jgi:hypothetical protein
VRTTQPRRSASRLTALILLVVGIVLLLFSIFADALDIGGGRGFGYQQLIGLIAGLVFIIGGLALLAQPYLSGHHDDRFEPDL